VSVKTSIVRVEVDGRQNRAGSLANEAHEPKKVLVIDIGRTSVKLLVSGQHKRRMLSSGRKMTADKMVRKTLELVSDWDYSVSCAAGRFASHTIWGADGWASILPPHSADRSRP
jgi:hypothetical protein